LELVPYCRNSVVRHIARHAFRASRKSDSRLISSKSWGAVTLWRLPANLLRFTVRVHFLKGAMQMRNWRNFGFGLVALGLSLISLPARAECVRTILNNSRCNWWVEGDAYFGSLTFSKQGCIERRTRTNSKRAARVSGAAAFGPVKLFGGCQFDVSYSNDLGYLRGALIFKTAGYEKTLPFAGFLKSCPAIDGDSNYLQLNQPNDGSVTITSCPRQSRTKRRSN
jgi:hypothetical protein